MIGLFLLNNYLTLYSEVYMIDDKPVVVTDPKKIREIREALKSSSESSFANVKAAEKDKLPENAAEMWFGKRKQ